MTLEWHWDGHHGFGSGIDSGFGCALVRLIYQLVNTVSLRAIPYPPSRFCEALCAPRAHGEKYPI